VTLRILSPEILFKTIW